MIEIARYLKTPNAFPWFPGRCQDQQQTTIARRFRSRTKTARYGRFGLYELCRWPQWILGHLLRQEYNSRRRFRGVVAASLGDATHTVLIVLVAAIRIALDIGNGGDEARTC